MCFTCVRLLFRKTAGAKNCPTCRAPLPRTPEELKPNHTLEQMIAYLLTLHPTRASSGGGSGPLPPTTLAALRLPLMPPPIPPLTSPFHPLLGGVQRVLVQVHPDVRITLMGARVVASLASDALERVAAAASRLCAREGRALLTARDVQTAVRAVLAGELAKHAVSEGAKAVTKLSSSGAPAACFSDRISLQFCAVTMAEQLREWHPSLLFTPPALAFATAVAEYLSAELLELAGNACKGHKAKSVGPRHIQLAVRNDEELNGLFRGVIPYGGVIPLNLKSLLNPVSGDDCPLPRYACSDALFGAFAFFNGGDLAEYLSPLEDATYMGKVAASLERTEEVEEDEMEGAEEEEAQSAANWLQSL